MPDDQNPFVSYTVVVYHHDSGLLITDSDTTLARLPGNIFFPDGTWEKVHTLDADARDADMAAFDELLKRLSNITRPPSERQAVSHFLVGYLHDKREYFIDEETSENWFLDGTIYAPESGWLEDAPPDIKAAHQDAMQALARALENGDHSD